MGAAVVWVDVHIHNTVCTVCVLCTVCTASIICTVCMYVLCVLYVLYILCILSVKPDIVLIIDDLLGFPNGTE